MIVHTADKPLINGIVGGLRFGASTGILEDEDLEAITEGEGSEEVASYALSLAATVALITAKSAALHVSQRTFGARIIASLNLINFFDDTYIGGEEAEKATMLALAPAGAGSLYF